MIITRISPFTRKEHSMDIPVTQEQMDRWQAGELIQNAMPNIPAEQREFIMTGIHPDEWKNTFGSGEDE